MSLVTAGHLLDNPGLRAHSYDPECALTRRYVVGFRTLVRPMGWLYEKSFDTLDEAQMWEADNQKDAKESHVWDSKTDENHSLFVSPMSDHAWKALLDWYSRNS